MSEPETLGELKLLILNRLEEWIFRMETLLASNQRTAAENTMKYLYHLFALLPPDVRESVKDAEEKWHELRAEQDSIVGADPIHTYRLQIRHAWTFIPYIRDTVARIQKLLYERYLQEKKRGMLVDPAHGKKSGQGKHDGFGRRIRARD